MRCLYNYPAGDSESQRGGLPAPAMKAATPSLSFDPCSSSIAPLCGYGSISSFCFLSSLPLSEGSRAPMPDIKHCSMLLFSLNFAANIAQDFLIPVPEEWVDCAKNVKVPFDAEKQYHPEYDGYSPGERRGSSGPLHWPWLLLCKPTRSGDSCSDTGTAAECLAGAKTSRRALRVRRLGCHSGEPGLQMFFLPLDGSFLL